MRSTERRRTAPRLAALLALAILAVSPTMAQQAAPRALLLSKIEIQGGGRLTSDQIIALSGLRVGQMLDKDGAEAAARRLVALGIFTGVRYHLDAVADHGELILVVGDEAWNTPMRFDNFVWFTDAEIQAAVAAALPTFEGVAPDTEGVIATIGMALTRLLDAKHLEGTIAHEHETDLGGRNPREAFRVMGIPLPICAWRFPQSTAISEADLAKSLKFMVGAEYSRATIANAIRDEVVPLYRQRGYLRASFGAAEAALATPAECKTGVVVTVPSREGVAYAWDHADWSGASAVTPRDLDAALGMTSGSTANGLVLDKGLRAIRRTYARLGYLEMSLAGSAMFDDNARRVTYRMTIAEGPPFRMGHLSTTGANAATAAKLEKLWPIPAGAPFDATRSDEFLQTVTSNHVLPAGQAVTAQPVLNHTDHTVDVTLAVR